MAARTATERYLVRNLTTTASPTATSPTVQSSVEVAWARDVRDHTSMSLYVDHTGGGSSTVEFEVTTDPDGLAGWSNAAWREAGGGAYGSAAMTAASGTPRCVFFDPADNVAWIRCNVTANTGTLAVRLIAEK